MVYVLACCTVRRGGQMKQVAMGIISGKFDQHRTNTANPLLGRAILTNSGDLIIGVLKKEGRQWWRGVSGHIVIFARVCRSGESQARCSSMASERLGEHLTFSNRQDSVLLSSCVETWISQRREY